MSKLLKSALCEECQARHQGICGALKDDQLERLAQHAHKRSVHVGETLLDPAITMSRFSVILKGAVKLTKLMPDGRQQIVGLQYAPDFLGRPYSKDSNLTIEAVTDATLCTFPRNVVEQMIAASPELEHRLYMQALTELDEARDLLLTLGQKTARERVSTFLLLIVRQARRMDSEPGNVQATNLLLTRAEIADFLGLTIETVSRQLHKLQSLGVVELEPKKGIRIIDTDKLVSEAGEVDAPLTNSEPQPFAPGTKSAHSV